MAHTGNGGEVTGGPRDRDIVAYPDIVPQMQAEPPPPFSEPASLGKYAPYLRGTQPGSRFVDCPVARLPDSAAPRVKHPTRSAPASSASLILTHPST